MPNRRTTVVAKEEDLEVLAHEARTRGLSLGKMLGEVVQSRAEELREARHPRLATFSAEVSIAEVSEREEPAARAFRRP